MNQDKDDVLPVAKDVTSLVFNELDTGLNPSNTGIIGIYHFSGLGYVYHVEFQGYSSTVEYMFGFDESGNVTGYKTIRQNETAGLGAKIADEEYYLQFKTKTIEDL